MSRLSLKALIVDRTTPARTLPGVPKVLIEHFVAAAVYIAGGSVDREVDQSPTKQQSGLWPESDRTKEPPEELMFSKLMERTAITLLSFSIFLTGCQNMPAQTNLEAEREAIVTTIKASIGWAMNKDKDLLYSVFAHDKELFFFNPDDAGNMSGFSNFQKLVDEFFMSDGFKATSYEIRELNVQMSRNGGVAWWACRLDDFCEINGTATGWEDIRWTGVMEKRDDRWQIVQMHFSYPTERMKG